GSMASSTRGAWISLPVVFVLFCIGLFTRCNRLRASIITLTIVVLACIGFQAVPDNPLHKGYTRTVQDVGRYLQGDARGSVGARLEVARAALINIKQEPFF